MTSASTKKSNFLYEVDVLLEVGAEGRAFTYLDRLSLGVNLGDLVLVRLRGRPMNGLVIAKRISSVSNNSSSTNSPNFCLADVEALIQVAAVEKEWREWIEAMAKKCHTSSFKMLKAALPPGWLGQGKSIVQSSRTFWWVKLLNEDARQSSSLPTRQSELHTFLDKHGGGVWQKDLYEAGFSASLVKTLLKRGLIGREKRPSSDSFNHELVAENTCLEGPRQLTNEQAKAIETFSKQASGNAFLLWGVTGSGKTEIYLQLAARELEKGRHCLILTPEIGLIPQLVDRCRRRFGSKVLEYHSGCSERERINNWKMTLNSQQALIVVGTRSAIFLPLSPLGLIVLDEEHDTSYKQDSPMPCYHARDLAINRAKRTGARVVLGTATPSLKTWKELAPGGAIGLARLTERVFGQKLPRVSVIDMRQELAEGHRKLISRPLMERLAELPEKKEQALILVPRRGYSSFISCRSCGEVVECPHCDVALTVHGGNRSRQWLRCHWCDHRESISLTCKNCGSNAFKPFGAGTQRVLEHLEEELKDLRFLRFDRDTTGGRDGHRKLLQKFAAGEADVLIGTQMLSKGMDLPRVTLAAVLAADGLLHRPDLNASEQSLQLFLQLAGRAGRGKLPGTVLVQTYCPEHPVILHLVDGRYEEFLKKESRLRSDAGLVPYRRACLLRISGSSSSVTATTATVLAEKVKPICESMGWALIGPAPALVSRVAGKSRWQVLMHGPAGSELPLPAGRKLWELLPKGVHLAVDPDPLQL